MWNRIWDNLLTGINNINGDKRFLYPYSIVFLHSLWLRVPLSSILKYVWNYYFFQYLSIQPAMKSVGSLILCTIFNSISRAVIKVNALEWSLVARLNSKYCFITLRKVPNLVDWNVICILISGIHLLSLKRVEPSGI